MKSDLQAYFASMSPDNPLRGFPARIVGDASSDPTEMLDHYDAFAYWAATRLARGALRRRILDLGSPKTQNAILSAYHDVTALVLADCSDRFTAVNYVQHDATLPLPFSSESFDCFTSTVALPLIGLGRYGDRIDGNSLPNLVSELGRVMSRDAELLVSLTVGPNLLAFNNGWYLELEAIKTLFAGWRLVEVVLDNWSSPKTKPTGHPSERFQTVDRAPVIHVGDYRVAFCAFVRDAPTSSAR